MAVATRTTHISLGMSEENALRLMALLVGSINWARNPWAKDLYDALQEAECDPTDDECDQVRREIQRYVEGTCDNAPDVLVGDIPVVDEEEERETYW